MPQCASRNGNVETRSPRFPVEREFLTRAAAAGSRMGASEAPNSTTAITVLMQAKTHQVKLTCEGANDEIDGRELGEALAGLRDAKLVSAEEYSTARMSILDDLVRGVAGASRT